MNEAIIASGFIYESAPFPSCHASTIVETGQGLLAGWFGGTHERHPDVCIYVSRMAGTPSAPKWSEPVMVADGVQADGSRQPCWNPVLFQPRGGPVMLFYKVGPSPSKWWGMVKRSEDDGRTWREAERLPEGILGPIKNKPIQLENGLIISPTSIEGPQVGWRVYFERSTDGGRTWSATQYAEQDEGVKAIQPSVLVHSQQRLQAVGRTRSKRMFEVWSEDGGQTWGRLGLLELPNPNSGTDAVTLQDGRHLLVYNHSETEKVRVPLNVAVSEDGRNWQAGAVLERMPEGVAGAVPLPSREGLGEGGPSEAQATPPHPASPQRGEEPKPPEQYSYPAVIQAADGLVHVTYTWKRLRIKHVVIDPQHLDSLPIQGGAWPEDVR